MKRVSVFLSLFVLPALFAQTPATPLRPDPESPNRCSVYNPPLPFRWTHMAVRPVDTPIVSYEVLTNFLAPRKADDGNQFDKPWQQLAKNAWKWTDDVLNTMYFAAQQGEGSNWRREIVRPCDTLADMIFGGTPERGNKYGPPQVLNRPVLVDFTDNGGREAWVFPVNDEIEAVFFKDCSNPSYRVKISHVTGPVEAPKPPPPPPQPALPPKIEVNVPAPIVNVPQQPAPIVNIPPPAACPAPQVTCRADHPVNITVQPAKVEVLPAPVQRIIIVNKVPWHQAMYNITGSAFHGVAIGWMAKNWNFRKDGRDGKDGVDGKDGQSITGPQGPQGPPGQSITGPQGPPGVGTPGPMGPQGPQGPGFCFDIVSLSWKIVPVGANPSAICKGSAFPPTRP